MKERDNQLDSIKALAIILVLLLHFRPLHIVSGNTFLIQAISFFYTNISLIAVPSFFLVSLYIYFKHKFTRSYTKERIIRLTKIYLFFFIINIGIKVLFFDGLDFNKTPFLELLWMGGPPIPEIGSSVIYFLVVLIVLTIVSYLGYGNKYTKDKEELMIKVSYIFIVLNVTTVIVLGLLNSLEKLIGTSLTFSYMYPLHTF